MGDNSHYKTSLHAAREIYQMEGNRGFYSGYCSCILTDCVNSGFQVLFYDALRRRYLRHKSREGEEMRVGVAGAVKGSSARRSRWPPPRA